MKTIRIGLLLGLLSLPPVARSQAPVFNEDERKVGTYTLPDPLLPPGGKPIRTARQWEQHRAEWLRLFASEVYGQTPNRPVKLRFDVTDTDENALNGKAIRKQVSIFYADYPNLAPIRLLLYLPKAGLKPAPVMLQLNFQGNHSISSDPGIRLSTRWLPNFSDGQVVNHRATKAARGMQSRRWPVDTILAHGYALATAYYGDIEPDHPEGWKEGIRSELKQADPARNWGAIGAWAWGMSRILDYLETESAVDAKMVVAMGHSRLGKAALWAGAQDPRFTAVVANESGEGGAALARRWYGETVERINTSFPHWFCEQYKTYNRNVSALPVDQHILLSLIAPRPLYVASAEDDRWSDPKGEFLGARYAEPVYQLYKKPGLGVGEQPGVNQPVGQTVRYHMRNGPHDVTLYDWQQYIRFADQELSRKNL